MTVIYPTPQHERYHYKSLQGTTAFFGPIETKYGTKKIRIAKARGIFSQTQSFIRFIYTIIPQCEFQYFQKNIQIPKFTKKFTKKKT
jgi:hypothetical protein